MSNHDTVYDSSPSGADLHFTFSTVQNSEPLEFTGDLTFVFNLYDAQEDLTGVPDNDQTSLILSRDSNAFSDLFILSEEDQQVSVRIPWDALQQYEENFTGDLYGILEVSHPLQGRSMDDYLGTHTLSLGSVNSKGYSADQIQDIKAELSNTHAASKIKFDQTIEARGMDPTINCCEDSSSAEGHQWPDDQCFCFMHQDHDACMGSCETTPGAGFITWTPISITPDYDLRIQPEEADGTSERCAKMKIWIDMVGQFTGCCLESGCEPFRATTPYVVCAYSLNSSMPHVEGWHDDVAYRQPLAMSGGSLLLESCDNDVYNGAKIIRIPVWVDIPWHPGQHQHQIFLTLDMGAPRGPDGHSGGLGYTGSCEDRPFEQCRCGCPGMGLPAIPRQPFWKIAHCTPDSADSPGNYINHPPNDASGCIPDCETGQCGAFLGDGAHCKQIILYKSKKDIEGVTKYWPVPDPNATPYQNCQHLWKNSYVENETWDYDPSSILDHQNHTLGADWPPENWIGPAELWPSRYTNWPRYFPHHAPDSPDCFTDFQLSDYFLCGGKYHIWVRFDDLH